MRPKRDNESMTTRAFIGTMAAGAVAVFLAPLVAAQVAGTKPLNVVFIVIEDMSPHLGCYGNPFIKTPNIDRLAKSGVLFTNAICNSPLCGPSRASFCTGRMPEATGVIVHNRRGLGGRIPELNSIDWHRHLPNVVTLPHHFKNNGYVTGHIGKIFNHTPCTQEPRAWSVTTEDWCDGKDSSAMRAELHKEFFPGKKPYRLQWNKPDRPRWGCAEDYPCGWALSPVFATRVASRFLDKYADAGKPFFFGVGHHLPHEPFFAPKKYYDLYPTDAIPASLVHTGRKIPGTRNSVIGKAGELPDESKVRQSIQAQYATITYMDEYVGRLLDDLDRRGLRDKTAIVLFSDHGLVVDGTAGCWGKSNIHSINVPLIISAPGMKRGAVCERVVQLVDLYPTLVDLCGLELPAGQKFDGRSMVPLLKEPETAEWEDIAYSCMCWWKCIRTQEWLYYTKVNASGEQTAAHLYDVKSDPRLTKDVLETKPHDEKVQDVERKMRRLMATMDDKYPDEPARQRFLQVQ